MAEKKKEDSAAAATAPAIPAMPQVCAVSRPVALYFILPPPQ